MSAGGRQTTRAQVPSGANDGRGEGTQVTDSARTSGEGVKVRVREAGLGVLGVDGLQPRDGRLGQPRIPAVGQLVLEPDGAPPGPSRPGLLVVRAAGVPRQPDQGGSLVGVGPDERGDVFRHGPVVDGGRGGPGGPGRDQRGGPEGEAGGDEVAARPIVLLGGAVGRCRHGPQRGEGSRPDGGGGLLLLRHRLEGGRGRGPGQDQGEGEAGHHDLAVSAKEKCVH